MRYRWTIAALLLAISTRALAQSPPDIRNLAIESFEAVSIRPNTTGERGGGMQPSGRLNIQGTTVMQLLTFAYNGLLVPERMVGLPEWARTDRYDIVGTPGRDVPDGRPYFRGLLRDRFGLRSHVEARDVDVYLLTIRPEGRGPGMRPTTVDCNDDDAVARARARQKPGEPRPCGGFTRAGEMSMSWATTNAVATMLSTQLGRPVINRTGLDGRFDFQMTWSPSLTATGADNPNDDRAGLFTAVQEQLGLRLQAARVPVDMLVIDSVSPPTPN